MADFDKVIPPGQEGKINVRIDGKKLSLPGPFEKIFTVRTNDPQRQQLVLYVVGTVKKALDFSSDMRWSGFVDEKMRIESVVTNLLPTPVVITSVRWAESAKTTGLADLVRLKLEEIERGKKYRVTAAATKPLPPGAVASQIILTTENPKLKEKTVQVTFDVLKDVEVQPERIYCNEMTVAPGGGKTFDYQFTIKAARGDSLRILKAVPNRDDMTVKIGEIQAGKMYRGTITIRPKGAVPEYLASVMIVTNYPGYREIPIDIVGSVQQSGR